MSGVWQSYRAAHLYCLIQSLPFMSAF
jgi:hypothetical protein